MSGDVWERWRRDDGRTATVQRTPGGHVLAVDEGSGLTREPGVVRRWQAILAGRREASRWRRVYQGDRHPVDAAHSDMDLRPVTMYRHMFGMGRFPAGRGLGRGHHGDDWPMSGGASCLGALLVVALLVGIVGIVIGITNLF